MTYLIIQPPTDHNSVLSNLYDFVVVEIDMAGNIAGNIARLSSSGQGRVAMSALGDSQFINALKEEYKADHVLVALPPITNNNQKHESSN